VDFEDSEVETPKLKDAVGFMITKLLEVHDLMKQHSIDIDRKIEDLHQKYDCDMRKVISVTEEKNRELSNAGIELERARNVELKLRSDIRVLVYQLRQKDDQINLLKDQLKSSIDVLSRKTASIEGKLDSVSTRCREIYSGTLQNADIGVHNSPETIPKTLPYADAVRTPEPQQSRTPEAQQPKISIQYVSPEVNVLNSEPLDGEASSDIPTVRIPINSKPKPARDNNNTYVEHSTEPTVRFDNEWERAFQGT
jgi:hypothetical protein